MEVQFCHLWASPSLPECRISPLLTDIAIIDHFSLTVLTWAHSRRFLILSCHQNSVSRSLLNSQVISQSQCKLTCLQDLTHVIVFFLKQSLPVFAKLHSSHFFSNCNGHFPEPGSYHLPDLAVLKCTKAETPFCLMPDSSFTVLWWSFPTCWLSIQFIH